jgi:hypothetical protein
MRLLLRGLVQVFQTLWVAEPSSESSSADGGMVISSQETGYQGVMKGL